MYIILTIVFFQRVTWFLQIRDCSIRIAQVNLTALIERLIALLEYIDLYYLLASIAIIIIVI